MPSGLCTRPAGSTSVTPAQGPAGDIFKRGLTGFMKEAETLARLNHPSIVQVAGYFEANGTAYMALAYLRGGSMTSWLKRLGRRPTQAELDQLLWPVTEALMQVHALFVLHRDVKPDNIMLRADGRPVLIDFGAIKSLVSSETRSIGAGTLNLVTDGYAPPEQYVPDGENLLGPWTDIYALGASVYEAITGTKPPSAQRRVIDETHRPLATLTTDEIGTGWRAGFLAGVDRALSLRRSDRPQSAMEFRQAIGLTSSPGGGTRALSEVATELATASVPPVTFSQLPSSPAPKSGPPARWMSRALAVAALVVLSGSGGLYAFRMYQAEQEAAARHEIGTATTSDVLDRIAGRYPKLEPEVNQRREAIAAIARAERLRLLREEIGRETSTARLDTIAAEEPEVRTDVEARKLVLRQRPFAARLQFLRERVPVTTDLGELTSIAAEAPELAALVEARKREIADQPKGNGSAVLGLTLSSLTDELKSRMKIDPKVRGLLIVEVDPKSETAERGIKAGEIIVEAAQEPMATVDDWRNAIEKARKSHRRSVLLLLANSKGEVRFVALPLN